MKTKRHSGIIILQLLFYIAGWALCFSCSTNNTEKKIREANRPDTFPPPVSILITSSYAPLADTCPPPRNIIIPTKPTRQTITLKNKELLKLTPAKINPADFLSSMQNYNTDNGLAMDVVTCAIMDKKGNLWFGTGGGGVSRYDGKSFTNYTTEQGLANNVVNSIVEDKVGNLWFGTEGGGISRYDGKSFTNYTTAQGLANDFVLCIAEDKIGNIWFGTDNGGVSRYNEKTGFTKYTTAQGLANNLVRCIMKDKIGNLWFGTSGGGVSCYNEKTQPAHPGGPSCNADFTNFTTAQGLANNFILSITEDKIGNLWFGTNGGGVSRYNGKSFTNYTTAQGLADNVVHTITQDKTGNLWFGTDSGASCYNGKFFVNYTTKQGLANNSVYSITEYRTGNIWFGTYGGGVSRYDGKSFINFTTRQGLAHNSVFSIAEDKTGNLWFGTYGGGVSCYDGNRVEAIEGGDTIASRTTQALKKVNGKFIKSFINYTTEQGLSNNFILSITEDKRGNLWFGTFGRGVSCYDRESLPARPGEPEGKATFTNYTTAQGLANNVVNCIMEDKTGNLWFGTNGGVSRYNQNDLPSHPGERDRKASFTNYTTVQGLANEVVNSMMEDKAGNIWFGTSEGGVSRYDGKSFTNYTTRQGLANNTVWSIREDKMGNIWFATSGGGVSRYDGKSFTTYTTLQGLPDNLITQVAITKEQNILFGTNFGIAMLTSFTPIPSREKQKKNGNIPAQNNLTNEELKNYIPLFEIYNSSTGYPVKDVNAGQNAIYVDSKGLIWIATGSDKTALVRFDYMALNKNNKPLDVFIQSVKINNEDVFWNDLSSLFKTNSLKLDSTATPANITEEVTALGRVLSDAERDTMRHKFGDIKFDSITKFYSLPQNLVLPYAHNRITFDFAAIEPSRPSLVRYQYILEGHDNNWSPITNKTTAIFDMYEGYYTFKLKARSPFGVWSEPIQYTFTVLPPWWRSGWMYTVYGIILFLISLSLYFYVAYRIRTIKKREEEKTRLHKRISEIEMKALRSQMNPHFIFNVMNSIQDYILENDRATAQDYLAKFARLMRYVLENSKAENITLENEIETLKLYVMLEQLRIPGKFTYKVNVESSISIMHTLIMPMLIQPFIENAIIHGIMHRNGNEGKIELTIKKSNDQLVCEIEDNGIGRKLSKKIKSARSHTHHSMGMNVTEERIGILNNLHGKKARVLIEDQADENGNPSGTKVTLTIPYIIQNN